MANMPLSPIEDTSTADPRHLGEIDRVHGITAKEFFGDFYSKRRPVVIEGLMDDWAAMERWSMEFFRTQCAEQEVRIGRCWGDRLVMPLGSYIEQMNELDPEGREAGLPPLYMEGWYYRDSRPDLAKDYTVPSFFGPDWIEARWFPFKPKPLFHGILIGPQGAFTKLHFDQLATHSWNAQIVGRKRWLLVSPDQLDHTYYDTRQSPGYCPGTDIDDPDLERFPLLEKVHYRTATVAPGELIWFPSMWMHQVLSLDATISLTHNYLTASNIPRFMSTWIATRIFGKQGV